jgi:hypothetical protein
VQTKRIDSKQKAKIQGRLVLYGFTIGLKKAGFENRERARTDISSYEDHRNLRLGRKL